MNNQITEAYYTIYYGFRCYRYNSKPPIIGRRKVAHKLGIPAKNIDVGITKNFPLWSPPNKAHSKLLLLVGQIRLAYEIRSIRER